MKFVTFVIAGALGAAPRDPCTQLCNRDGPTVCTGGSWSKPDGTCQAYLFRGNSNGNDYCYHTAATAATCPTRGASSVRITDVARLLGGVAPAVPPRQQTPLPPRPEPVPQRPQPSQHRPEPVQPSPEPVQATGEALGALLGAYSDDEVDDFCQVADELRGLIDSAVTDPAFLRMSAVEFWEQTNDARLLDFASQPSSCVPTLIRAVIALATNVPHVTPLSFAATVGLTEFCREHAATILSLLEIFDTRPARIAALHEVVARTRAAAGRGGQQGLTVARARSFSDSIRFLTGPVVDLAHLPVVRFSGEAGTDAGGLGRDWFTSIARLVFTSPSGDPAGGLFTVRPGTEYLELNAARPFTSATRAHFNAVGRYLGMSIGLRLPIGVPLPRMFFRRLLDQAVTLEDIELDDEELRRSLRQVETGGVDMIRALEGLDADDDVPTVQEYITEQLRGIIPRSMNERLAAIREGFNAIVPIEGIRSIVTPDDLRSVIHGTPEISVEDLMAHTTYNGRTFTASSPQIQWLWDWLRRADNDVRRKFLRFVTGLSQLPIDGMAGAGMPIHITRSHVQDLAPRSHTCSYTLDMPIYRTAAELEEWMGAAVSSDGFGMA